VTQEGLDRFTDELLVASEFSKILYFNTFPTFQATRTQRDIMYKLKKFTELADKRITRYMERQAERGNIINIKFRRPS